MILHRRTALTCLAAAATAPSALFAASPREILWDDLIPPGVPYSEIIGPGIMDEENDTWAPEFDEHATKLNEALNGTLIKIPGFIIPFEITDGGVTEFLLVPYIGACLHVPPPPANQLIMVTAADPWPNETLWEAVWVIGTIRTALLKTTVGQAGYAIQADRMETYVW